MASLKNLEVGQKLYRLYKHKMGNTMINTTDIHIYTVIEINIEEKTVILSGPYNGMHRKFSDQRLKDFKVNKPELKESFTGSKSVVTKSRKKQEQ